MDPLSRGRELYKQKDYNGALEAFTEVINFSSDHILLTALDHRAATFEKLAKLQPALRDAKSMIDLKPGLAKGYLRCAKILQLKGNESLALEIYERGLKKVKVGDDPDRPLLQQIFHKLQQKQAHSKTFDPLVMLPNELAQMACEYLSMRDLVVCLAVSKPWKHFLEVSHDLWKELDLRYARRLVRPDSLKVHLRRSNYKLDRAMISMNRSIFNAKYLEVITRTCKHLRYLELSSVGFFGDSLLAALPKAESLRTLMVRGSEMTLHTVVAALGICPQLEVIEFDTVKLAHWIHTEWPPLASLQSLKLTTLGSQEADPLNLDSLISSTPNLRSASLIHTTHGNLLPHYTSLDVSRWRKLEYLEFSGSHLAEFRPLPETLKHLDISRTRLGVLSPLSTTIIDQQQAFDSLHNLESFICYGCINIDLCTIFTIIKPSIKAKKLKTLHLSENLDAEDPSRAVAELSIPSLRELSFRGWTAPEEALIVFLRQCPEIRHLDASQTKITGVAVKELMTRESGPLERLCLNDCTKLSSDAVDYARSLGAVVEYSFNQGKPKMIRHFRDRLMGTGSLIR